MAPKKVIIDCDTGTDDAQAIMMVLAYPNLAELVAVTSVFGNTTPDNSSRNVLRVLNVCDKLDVPVYQGCSSTLLGNTEMGGNFHGTDGLGDVPHLYPPGDGKVKDEHAANALVRLAKDNPGQLTLLAIGPLTNLAAALKLDADFGKNLKEVCIMGGNTTGQGNMTTNAEFNFYSDPEAAQYCLNHLNTPVTMVTMELCEQQSFLWEWHDAFSRIPTEKAKFVKTVEAYKVNNAKRDNAPKYDCFDQLASAVTLDENVITGTEEVYATVELNGTYTRGQVIVDRKQMLKKPNNVKLITAINDVKYEAMLYAAVGYTPVLP